jgi:hypothetical protein
MMMNIRGLIADDPELTVYLQTFKYSAESDTVVGDLTRLVLQIYQNNCQSNETNSAA